MAKRKSDHETNNAKKVKADLDSSLSESVFSSKLEVEDWDNIEQSYELTPRAKTTEAEVETLPIKRGGKVERVVRKAENNNETKNGSDEKDLETKEEVKKEVPKPVADTRSPMEKLQSIKEDVASLASKLLEDPEENIECLSKLKQYARSSNVVSSQLAILSLVPVFKSLAPGYNIRPLTDVEKREKVGKEIARARRFEQNLISNYHDYLDLLSKLAKVSSSNSQNSKSISRQQIKLGEIASKAACELCLSSLRFFNYRDELFTIPIKRLNKKPSDKADLEIFTKCLRTLETLLKEDKEHGSITSDITRIMCKVIRDKKFRVDEAVINVFLSLSLLEDYDPHQTKSEKPKLRKKDRVHLSKTQKKARKELKGIEEEIRKAEQTITAEERERFQSQSLKSLLTLYLEILKAGSIGLEENTSAKQLTAAVMEGLSRFGQMANFDLLGDFIEVLKEIMMTIVEEHSIQTEEFGLKIDNEEAGGMFTPQEVRKLLLCVTAAFSLVLNNGEVGRLPISFDLSKFISILYAVIVDVGISSDLEFSHKSLRLADPLSTGEAPEKPAVNVSTNAELLLKSLDLIFFRSRNGSVARAMPFTKRLYIMALQTPEKTTTATLKFIAKLINKYGDGLKSLWSTEETIAGEGSYILGTEKEGMEVDLERSNAGSAVLWENALLDKHYCTIIKDGSRSLMKNSKISNSK